jgi:hypothetical protein
MRKITASLGLLMLAVLTGCVPAYTGQANGPMVAVIGDSITRITDPYIHDVLDPDYSVSVRGIDGATTEAMQPYADAYSVGLAGGRPDVVVINLGTNDSWNNLEPMSTALQLLAMDAKFRKACTVLVTLNTHTFSSAMNWYHAQLNEGIRQHSHVVDWDALVATSSVPITYDGVHPTEHGGALFAQAIRAQVDGCLGP